MAAQVSVLVNLSGRGDKDVPQVAALQSESRASELRVRKTR